MMYIVKIFCINWIESELQIRVLERQYLIGNMYIIYFRDEVSNKTYRYLILIVTFNYCN